MNHIVWKKFSLKSIFKIEKCTGTKISNLIEGQIPYVSRSSVNNGITRLCGNKDYINPKNTITIHAEWKENYCAFYQEEDYVTDGMIAFLSCEELNKYNGLFITTILSKTKYSGKGLKESLNDLSINLPVLYDGQPDWEYMSNEIKQLENEIKQLENEIKQSLYNAIPKLNEINTTTWKEFKVSDLFVNKKNKRYSKIFKTIGATPFVSSTSVNNGIVKYVDLEPNQLNAITVSTNGACFDCFWHDYDFCASTDVEILYPRFNITTNIALFICTCLAKWKGKYSYKNKPKNGIVWKTFIKLPIKNSQPDWEYMEKYMKNKN